MLNQVFDEVLAVRDMGPFAWRMLSNAFYGENPLGEWQIEVFDGAATDMGQLYGWRIRFYYGNHPE